jgi:peroxiredoxin
MALTERFYGANTAGTSRPIQDFGLSDTKGVYQYTAKLRVKGLLVVVFFSPDSPPSVKALETVQAWTAETPTQKWTALGVGEGDRTALAQFAEAHGLSNLSILLDFELYQTRMWGVSHLPSIYLISGKTGRVLHKIVSDDAKALDGMKAMLADEVGKIIAAEEAAKEAAKKAEEQKKADEEKKAAEAKTAETAKPSA